MQNYSKKSLLSLLAPSSKPSLEKSLFVAPKSQDLVAFRKEIEANNLQVVYETIWNNPRFLVSSGDTPSILKEGPRYNALHIAAIYKHAKMAKLILQTVEQKQFVELLHGCKNDATSEVQVNHFYFCTNLPNITNLRNTLMTSQSLLRRKLFIFRNYLSICITYFEFI